jgi:hypothetical protein
MANGPPIMIPNEPVKNMIRALDPRLDIALRSMLNVIKIRAAGSKYLLAIKYRLEVSSDIRPILAKMEGST